MIAPSARPSPTELPRPAPASPAVEADHLLETLYEQHADGMVRWMTAHTRDPELAADVVHEAFLRLARELRGGRCPDSPPAWLGQVARNLATSHARRVATASRFQPMLVRRDMGDDPALAVLARERAVAVRAALACLRPVDSEALVLAAQGLSGAEIAERIGRSELATRVLIHRARRRLRPHLALLEPARLDPTPYTGEP